MWVFCLMFSIIFVSYLLTPDLALGVCSIENMLICLRSVLEKVPNSEKGSIAKMVTKSQKFEGFLSANQILMYSFFF